MARIWIHAVVDGKVRLEHRVWSLLSFILRNFPDEMEQVNRQLFSEDWDGVIPDKPGWTALQDFVLLSTRQLCVRSWPTEGWG